MNLNAFGEGLVTIALAIVGLAIVATLVSKNARTSQVAQATAGGFSESLLAAVSPVTGQAPSISWPNDMGNLFGS